MPAGCFHRDDGSSDTVRVTVGVIVFLHPPASYLTVRAGPPEQNTSQSQLVIFLTISRHHNPPLDLVIRGRKTGRSDELVKADAATSPGPDVEQGDVVPPVPAGAAEWDELLVSDYQADLERDNR